MKVKNAHEEHVLECYDKNKIYLYLVNQLKSVNTIDEDKIWICRNSGHVVIGKYAPEVCPVCNHPQSYFEVKANNY